jgi:Glycosyl hydrolase family 79 C-terminal beta domain/Glycosyl hydrolase family 79, N-terminal domain
MDRRTFLKTSAAAAAASAGYSALGQTGTQTRRISLVVSPERALGEIFADFLGLGYEISSVARPGLLSARNAAYVRFIRNLGRRGVIRVGGNTSDFSSYQKDGPPVCATKATVVDDSVIRDLGEFLDATGWQLIWGLNLGSRDVGNAVDEAASVIAATKDKLLAFEIGNEPDLFAGAVAHRPKTYSYADFLKEYREYKAALRAQFPKIPFGGPDVASHTDWLTQFAADEGSDLKLLTHHRYAEGPPTSPASTIERLLAPSEGLTRMLAQCEAASRSAGVPYRICETNSCYGGGKPGVSDTLAAALWGLDYLFAIAAGNGAGANFQTGVNHLGFVSSYSPIADDEAQRPFAKPLYYAMLAFAKAGRGTRIGAQIDANGMNVAAYAVKDAVGRVFITMINKGEADAAVALTLPGRFRKASLLRLEGPSLDSKTRVTLGGAEVDANGNWSGAKEEPVGLRSGACEIQLSAASAAIMTAEG